MDSATSAGGARAKAIIGYNPKTKEIIQNLKKDFEHYLMAQDIQKIINYH